MKKPHLITVRDVLILKRLIECRAMTTLQIETAFFAPTSRSRCIARMKYLFDDGLVGRIEQPTLRTEGRKPYIYVPKRKAVQLIAQEDDVEIEAIEWDKQELRAGYPFLAHILAITDVNVAFTAAAHRHGGTIDVWHNDLILKRRHMVDQVEIVGPNGAVQKASVVPDAYIVLRVEGQTYHHFLEVDRGTEIGQSANWGKRDIARKIYAYLQFMASGDDIPSLYEQRYGTNKGRILFVATSARRMQTLKEVCENCGGRARFWFTTLDQLTSADPFTDPIWYKAGSADPLPLVW